MTRLKIVIADDEAIIRMDLKEILEEAGHLVIGEASNGETAVELVRQKCPDLVIMDVKMPGMDGITAARVIHQEKLAPVLLLTAYSQTEFITEAKNSGVLAYLIKPITEKNLFPAIEIASSRFKEFLELEKELDVLKETLETRKWIDRAKGIIMDAHGLSEQEAYRRLQQYSMVKGKPLREVAKSVISASQK